MSKYSNVQKIVGGRGVKEARVLVPTAAEGAGGVGFSAGNEKMESFQHTLSLWVKIRNGERRSRV